MISFTEGNHKFNFRLGAVVISQDRKKVLLHTISGYGFYLLPGGRLEFMESSVDGIRRELREELGLDNVKPRLIATVENFFIFKGVHFHEVSQNYVVYLGNEHRKIEEHEQFSGQEGDQYIYKWFSLRQLDEISLKPPLLKDIILQHEAPSCHIVLDERPPASTLR